MIVVPNYRGFRIEITAQLVEGAWDAGVRIRYPQSNDLRRAKYLACRKPTPVEAEHSAEFWAKRWMDGMARLARVIGRANKDLKLEVAAGRSARRETVSNDRSS